MLAWRTTKWRPSSAWADLVVAPPEFGRLRRDLARHLHAYNLDREHHGRITQGRRPADLVHAAREMEPR